MNKKIGIIGSRRRNRPSDRKAVELQFFQVYKEGDIICSGGCPEGGDKFAEEIAKKYGIPILIYYPNWKKFGRSAGFVRNDSIAESSDIIIACVAEDRKGGTEDTIKKYIKLCGFDRKNEELYLV